MSYLFIYLLQIVEVFEALTTCSVLLSFFSLAISSIFYMVCSSSYYNDENQLLAIKKIQKSSIIILIIGIFLSFIPTKQTMLLFSGWYLGQKTINTVKINDKIQKVNTIIDLQLDKQIKELQNEE